MYLHVKSCGVTLKMKGNFIITCFHCLCGQGGFLQIAGDLSQQDRTPELCALTWIPAAPPSTAASRWQVAWRSRRPCGGSRTLAAAAHCHRLTPDR